MIYSSYESWIAILLACIATLFWRFLGVLLAEKINTNGILMHWINTVAYSMVASVMMILLIYPSGILSTTTIENRLVGLIIGILVMLSTKRLFISIISGIGSFAILVIYF